MWTLTVTFPNGHKSTRAFYVIDDAYRYATYNVSLARISKIEVNHCITCDKRTLFDATWTPESNAAALKMPDWPFV